MADGCSTIDRFQAGDIAALKPKARSKKPSEGRSLTPAQEHKIRQLICDKRSEQLKMDFVLWTRAAVMLLIARECAITLSIRAVGNYLKRWGFTLEKPVKTVLILDNLPVHHWKIVKAWLAERADSIEVFYPPIYAQELNPDERLNADLKHNIAARHRVS